MLLNKIKIKGIRWKMLRGIFVIFFVSIIYMAMFISNTLVKNYEGYIEKDLEQKSKEILMYTNQCLILSKMESSEKNFVEIYKTIIGGLSTQSNDNFVAYRINGEILGEEDDTVFHKYNNNDLKSAVNGKSSYTLNYLDNEKLIVNSSVVVSNDEGPIGIIRINSDYSRYRRGMNDTRENMLIICLVAFVFICLALEFYISKIIKPIIELSEYSTKVAIKISNNDRNEYVPEFKYYRKDDEIGQLSKNYFIMLHKIYEQMNIIKDERDIAVRLYEHKKEFYDNVTHELKTPLTTIEGYAEVLLNNGFNDEKFFHKGLNHIIHESKRLHKMVINLLEMSSNSNKDIIYEKVDLSKISKGVCDSMSLKAKRYGNTLNLDLESETFINGQADKLKELLINLVDNAIKYGKENSIIEIIVKKHGDKIILSVANEGIGISKEQQKDIFKPFYRLDKNKAKERGSSGLGLSICKKIVENHNGQIGIQSEINGKTIFIIKFWGYNE